MPKPSNELLSTRIILPHVGQGVPDPVSALHAMGRPCAARARMVTRPGRMARPWGCERFARQYRCGPPPEFPLASPRSGIVHHLSGPDRHAHTRTLLKGSESVGGAPHKGDPTNQLPYALWVYSPVDSHTCQTPWSVFQDGPNEVPAGRFQEHAGAVARRYSARFQPQSAQRHLHKLINSMGFGRHTNPHRGLGLGPSLRTLLQTTIQTTRPSDFQAGLFPLRSPLLRESFDKRTTQEDCLINHHQSCVTRQGTRISANHATGTGDQSSPNMQHSTVRLFCYAGFDNDPSAGSPTETLLRLLLPLNDKVQWNSRDVAGIEPPTSPRS
ncbi:hypothetical protein R6Q57_001372 [Mikania cordata]